MMQKGFQHILVPSYPTLDAEAAVERAAKWSNGDPVEIQVVHMLNPFLQVKAKVFPTTAGAQPHHQWIEKQRQLTKATINSCEQKGESVTAAICSSVTQYHPDLVVLPANKKWWPFNGYLSAARLATTTGVPVLQLKGSNKKTTSIVVPVLDGVRSATLEQISVISKKNEVDVHLVSYKRQAANRDEDLAPLGALQAYQWLKSYVKCPVEFSRVSGTSETKAVINYLHQLQNDVLLLR